MSTELVLKNQVIQLQQLDNTTCNQILKAFNPTMEAIQKTINESSSITKEDQGKEARLARLKLITLRGSSDKSGVKGLDLVKKGLKQHGLLVAKSIDGAYNILTLKSKEEEARLEVIEKAEEIRIKAEADRLEADRLELLKPFPNFNTQFADVRNMDEETFQLLLTTQTDNKRLKEEDEKRKAEAAKAEKEREEREKIEKDKKLKKERLEAKKTAEAEKKKREEAEAETVRVKEEAEAEAKKIAEAEKVKQDRIEAKAKAERDKLEVEKKIVREKAEAAKKEAEAKQRLAEEAVEKIKREAEAEAAKAKKAIEEREAEIKRQEDERIATEKARVEADRKEKEDNEKRIAEDARQAELAPDKDKLIAFADSVIAIPIPVIENQEAAKVVVAAQKKLQELRELILSATSKL